MFPLVTTRVSYEVHRSDVGLNSVSEVVSTKSHQAEYWLLFKKCSLDSWKPVMADRINPITLPPHWHFSLAVQQY